MTRSRVISMEPEHEMSQYSTSRVIFHDIVRHRGGINGNERSSSLCTPRLATIHTIVKNDTSSLDDAHCVLDNYRDRTGTQEEALWTTIAWE